jgi:3-hydroxyisobutyrate dehydrogenase-like beta-hydroxyacid dehydrogenase
MPDKQLGFIGVGRMGIHMAGRLLDAGYAVTVFDTNETAMQRLEQRGAKRAASAADVASKCETVLVSLPTPDVVKSVALGAAGVIEGNQGQDIRRSLDHRPTRCQGRRRGPGA